MMDEARKFGERSHQTGNICHGDMAGGDIVQSPTTSLPQILGIVMPSDAERATWPEATEQYVAVLEATVRPNASVSIPGGEPGYAPRDC